MEGQYDFVGVQPLAVGEESEWYDHCRTRRLMIQRCSQCLEYQFPPRSICQECLSDQVSWVEASGNGVIFTFTIQFRSAPGFSNQVPYVIAMIDLEEGPRMMSRFVGPVEQAAVGLPVELRWADIAEGLTVPIFVAAGADV